MRLFGLVAAATLLLAGAAAQATSFDRLYVFGDSLVDTGNAQAGRPDKVPPLFYPTGRFTNGYNFADDLSVALGLGLSRAFSSPVPGYNFAVGGATTTPFPGQESPDLGQQIKTYYEPATGAGLPAIDANSLVLVATGGNDVRDFAAARQLTTLTGIVTAANATLTALTTDLQRLIADGARNILVVGVPDIGLIPSVVNTANAGAATSFSNLLNYGNPALGIAGYTGVVAGLQTQLGTSGAIQLFDLAGLQRAITASPAAYGLDGSLLKTSCVAGGGTGTSSCAGYAYYDDIHPTAQLHGLIAQGLAGLVPEPDSWMLMIVGFGFTGTALRRARRLAAA